VFNVLYAFDTAIPQVNILPLYDSLGIITQFVVTEDCAAELIEFFSLVMQAVP